jgi:hypothetical protein
MDHLNFSLGGDLQQITSPSQHQVISDLSEAPSAVAIRSILCDYHPHIPSTEAGEAHFPYEGIFFSHFFQAARIDGIEFQFIHGRERFPEVKRVQDRFSGVAM